jgi:hypothetical protein
MIFFVSLLQCVRIKSTNRNIQNNRLFHIGNLNQCKKQKTMGQIVCKKYLRGKNIMAHTIVLAFEHVCLAFLLFYMLLYVYESDVINV